MKTLNKNIDNIKIGYLQGITNAVWIDDEIQLQAILDGLNALPDIEFIEIKVNGSHYVSSGKSITENVISNTFPLMYQYNNKNINIGSTYIEASLTSIYSNIIDRIWIILTSNAIKTLLIVLFMYFLFQKIVFNRLNKIFEFVRQHDLKNLNNKIDIEQSNKSSQPDEISEIVNALNNMQDHLSISLNELLALKTTLDLFQDGVFMFDTIKYNFFYTNTGAQKLLGYNQQELQNMTPIDISHDLDKLHFKKLINQTIKNNNNSTVIEIILINKKGNLIPVRLILQYLNPENEEPRFVFIARDITQRRKDEQLLLRTIEDTNIANEAKSKFMMSMSHELRTPLNAILGFAQLLQLDAKLLNENQNDAVHDILISGELLLKLIEDILDLTTIESNNVPLMLELVNPVNLIEQCIIIVKPIAELKGITLVNKITKESSPEINVDQTRFKQILINLLTNAIKYNTKNGTVTIKCELKNNDIIRFKVIDTGFGIAKTEQAKIFSPFNRLGYEGGEIEGTGIGLSITKKLIELMNGEINFESTVNKGSCFWIDFPYKKNTSNPS
jgi:PAS domain S-box-containing protein